MGQTDKKPAGRWKRQGGKTIYQGKCVWRRQIKRRAGVWPGLNFCCIAILGAELAVLSGRLSPEERMRFRVVNSKEEYIAEWILPSQMYESDPQDVYGIRICPKKLELEFYHKEEKLRPAP